MPLEKVSSFQKAFEQVVSQTISPTLLSPTQVIDIPLSLEDVSWSLLNTVHRMAPFGTGNPIVTFVTHHLVARSYRIFQEKHLKLYIPDPKGSRLLEAIGFGLAMHAPLVEKDQHFSIVYTLEQSVYQNQKTLLLNIQSIRPCVR